MGKETGIAWTDATFNPWWGCEKVSPACHNCYAARDAKRFGFGHVFDGSKQRRFFGMNHWYEPEKWDKEAKAAGVRKKVFCGSMCDVFEDLTGTSVKDYDLATKMNDQRDSLWKLIMNTPNLDWLLLTKRPENISRLMYSGWRNPENIPANVRIGITVENQEYADKRIPELLKNWKGKNFLSVEPMLGPVNLLQSVFVPGLVDGFPNAVSVDMVSKVINWVICGGESGSSLVRPLNPSWVRNLRWQCINAGVPFFFKQWGAYEYVDQDAKLQPIYVGNQFTHLLDGVEWRQFPA